MQTNIIRGYGVGYKDLSNITTKMVLGFIANRCSTLYENMMEDVSNRNENHTEADC